MELLQKKYLGAERAVWEPEEPAQLSERERKNRFSEKSRSAHHFPEMKLSFVIFRALNGLYKAFTCVAKLFCLSTRLLLYMFKYKFRYMENKSSRVHI